MKLTLPILYNTDETQTLRDSGIDYNLEKCTPINVTFYQITAIKRYVDKDTKKVYTTIFANGTEFTTTLHPAKVEKLIDDASRPTTEV